MKDSWLFVWIGILSVAVGFLSITLIHQAIQSNDDRFVLNNLESSTGIQLCSQYVEVDDIYCKSNNDILLVGHSSNAIQDYANNCDGELILSQSKMCVGDKFRFTKDSTGKYIVTTN